MNVSKKKRGLEYWILNNKHEPVSASLEEWCMWFQSSNRQVADLKYGGVRVSTVFLGLDQEPFGNQSAPVLFETMVFGGAHHEETWRWCTWDEAVAGHEAAIKRVFGPHAPTLAKIAEIRKRKDDNDT